MVAKTLVDGDIEAGRRLIEKLDEQKVPVRAALWLYEPEFEGYRLLLASSLYDQSGASKAYQAVVKAINALSPNDQSRLTGINIVGISDDLVKALSRVIHTGPSLDGIRFSGNQVGQTYVDDAWIYRLN